jgi:D-aspartate ligase
MGAAPAAREWETGLRREGTIADSTSPVAIVIGRDQTGLGMLRSLHAAGIAAVVACPAGSFITRSRWYRPTPGDAPWDGEPGPHAYEYLRAMPLERAVVICGRDDAALWAADLPSGPLAERFLVCSSPRSVLETLQDKARFGEFLAHTDMPHPRTFTVRSAADIGAIPFGELDRVFIKPVDSQRFVKITGAKGIWVSGRSAFERTWEELEAQGLHVIAQEYVPGKASDHYFIDGFRDRQGALTGLFARRRMRIYPPHFGNSSYCVSIPLGEIAEARHQLGGLLERLQYRGIFSAEFKRDSRDGKLRILEINTRAWWYVDFAARCGINVCRMAYEDALGLSVTRASADYPIGVGCTHLARDIRAVCARAEGQRVSPWKALMQWSRGYFSVFRLDDPMPGLLELRRELWRALRHFFGGARADYRSGSGNATARTAEGAESPRG